MNGTRKYLWFGALASAVLMSLPWLVPHCGWVALFGLVPLLLADRLADLQNVRRFRVWHYSAFVLWNAFTTFWIWNATPGGAVFAILANALQMSLVWGLFRMAKRHVGGVVPYVFLAAAWIAWERWYLVSAQISWPWLVLGNAFAGTTSLIQWYEYTGTLGGSLWVWACNLCLFGLSSAILEGRIGGWSRRIRTAVLAGSFLIIAFPIAASLHIGYWYRPEASGCMPVIIAQPDFDPYEKFESLSQEEQTAILLDQFGAEADSLWEGLLIAPETFTSDIHVGDVASSPTFRSFQDFLSSHRGASLLFGASTWEFFLQRSAPTPLARPFGDSWVVSHNSALVTDASAREEIFHKSKLVVGVESTPYPAVFLPLDRLLGGVMGRCVGQDRVTAMHCSTGGEDITFGCAICYESVYPEYCTEYVRGGARFLTVITNDAWWGDTPGYRQHLNYSRLRAIELRRDVARCANTGISAIIDSRGDIVSRTSWWKRETLRGEVNLYDGQTFFVRAGDMVGRASVLVFLLLLLRLLVALIAKR